MLYFVAPGQRLADNNPLSPLSHTYRFAKMHEKIHFDQPDEIVPYVSSLSLGLGRKLTSCPSQLHLPRLLPSRSW